MRRATDGGEPRPTRKCAPQSDHEYAEVLTLRYALGVDGGGSKCDAVLIAEDGTVAGRGRGGPTHHWYSSPEVIAASFADALAGALDGITGAQLWVAGHFHSHAAREALEAAGEVVGWVRGGEIGAAYACAGETWGMILLSGTGAFVHLRTPDGRSVHTGGLGPVLGDYGSGHDIGLKGLRAAFAGTWLDSRATSLREAIPAALGVATLKQVFELVYEDHVMDRRRIASLARTVNDEAEAGDVIARRCIVEAADEQAQFAIEVIEQLDRGGDLTSSEMPVIASGSVAQGCRIWWEHICERLREVVPHMRPIIPQVRPVVGAALLALREMGVELTPKLLDRIVETQARYFAVENDA